MGKRYSQSMARNYRWKVLGGKRFWRCVDCPKMRNPCPGGEYAATDIPNSCRLRGARVSEDELFPES